MTNDNNYLLDPESVLPDQYFAGLQLPPFVQNEARLMLAILQDAVDTYQRHALAKSARQRAEFEDARDWIASTESEWVFSFENICSVLGIDADYVRDGLRRHTPTPTPERRALRKRTPKIRPLAARRAAAPAPEDEPLKIAS